MNIVFKPIAHSWVAENPNPIGVVQFIGGALYGTLPTISYRHFLQSLFEEGYTIIAVPFQFGLNHGVIARGLLDERDRIRQALDYPEALPHFWIGHSLGCKYIALLEAYSAEAIKKGGKNIINEPSLLVAPDISDTKDAIPIPGLPYLLDYFSLGVRPTKKETQDIIRNSGLFNLTALISFRDDDIAGNATESPDESDVAWFIHELEYQRGKSLLRKEIPGGHREPIGMRVGDSLVDLNPWDGIFEPMGKRHLEGVAIQFLAELVERRGTFASEKLQEIPNGGNNSTLFSS